MDAIAEAQVDHGTANVRLVSVTINGRCVEMRAGRHTGAQIKAAGGINAADELAQIIDRQLKPLADDSIVVIHGCEVFVSHPKSCSSS